MQALWDVFNTFELHSDKKHGASRIKFTLLPAQVRLYSARAFCAGVEVFTPFEFQHTQLPLLMKNPFLVVVLGFGVVDSVSGETKIFQIVCTGAVVLSYGIQMPVSV